MVLPSLKCIFFYINELNLYCPLDIGITLHVNTTTADNTNILFISLSCHRI